MRLESVAAGHGERTCPGKKLRFLFNKKGTEEFGQETEKV